MKYCRTCKEISCGACGSNNISHNCGSGDVVKDLTRYMNDVKDNFFIEKEICKEKEHLNASDCKTGLSNDEKEELMFYRHYIVENGLLYDAMNKFVEYRVKKRTKSDMREELYND